jgi:hypothetical protein
LDQEVAKLGNSRVFDITKYNKALQKELNQLPKGGVNTPSAKDLLEKNIYKDNDGNFIICDWKRSKEISQSNKYETGLFPLENLENCNFNHYCLQQNLYKRMIKECHNIDVKELYLIILHPNNSNYIKFKLPCFDNEIELLYLSRIKYLKNKGYSEKLFENMAFSNKNKEKIEKGIKNDDIISETIMETEKDEIIVPLMNRINTVSKQKNALEILEKYKYKKDPINSKSGLSEKQQKAFELMNKTVPIDCKNSLKPLLSDVPDENFKGPF